MERNLEVIIRHSNEELVMANKKIPLEDDLEG